MGFLLFSGGPAPQAEAPRIPEQPVHTVTLTAYNAVAAQTDDTPFETASGAYSHPAVVAARSVDLAEELPFGTIIEIDGSNIPPNKTCGFDVVAKRIGYRVIADSMNARYTKRIDILFDTKTNAANVLGICAGATIRVVGYVNIQRIPTTQAELAALVMGKDGLALK